MGCNRKLWENVTLTVLIYRKYQNLSTSWYCSFKSFYYTFEKINSEHWLVATSTNESGVKGMCYRGLQFSKLDGIHTDSYRYLKKQLFTCCKIFENVPFFEHMYSNFAKTTNMTKQKKFFDKFLGWFKIFENVPRSVSKKHCQKCKNREKKKK
jgi:hypothetical protein